MAIYTDDKFSITFDQENGGFVFESIKPGTMDSEIMSALSERQDTIVEALENRIDKLLYDAIEAGKAAGHDIDINSVASLAQSAIVSLGLQAAGEKSSAQAMLDTMAITAFEHSIDALKNPQSLENALETKPSGSGGPDVVTSVDPVDNDAAIVAGIQSDAQAAENEAIASEPETAPLTITISGGRVERAVIMGHGKDVEQKNEAVERMQDLAAQIDPAYKEQLTYTNRQGQKVAVDGREGERTRAVAIDVGAKIGLNEDDLRQMPISEFNARLEQHLIALQQKQEADVQVAAAEITEPAPAATTEVAATSDAAPATVAPAAVDPRQTAFDAQIEEADKALAAMGDRAKTPDAVEATVANPAAPKTTIDADGTTVITIAERMAIVSLSPRDVMGFDVHVQTAQAALKDMGYKIAEANGRQDLATNAAFEKFARDHKIDAGSMTLEDFKEYAVATQQGLDPSTMVASSSPSISSEFLHKASATVLVQGNGPVKEIGMPPPPATPPQELSAIDEHIRIMTGGMDPDKQNRYDPNAPSLRESFNQLAKGIMFWRDDPENETAADQSNQQEAPQGAPVENRTLPATPPPGSQWT